MIKDTKFITKNNEGSELGFFYFILNSPTLTRDVTCSRLYLDGKKYEETMSGEHPYGKRCQYT